MTSMIKPTTSSDQLDVDKISSQSHIVDERSKDSNSLFQEIFGKQKDYSPRDSISISLGSIPVRFETKQCRSKDLGNDDVNDKTLVIEEHCMNANVVAYLNHNYFDIPDGVWKDYLNDQELDLVDQIISKVDKISLRILHLSLRILFLSHQKCTRILNQDLLERDLVHELRPFAIRYVERSIDILTPIAWFMKSAYPNIQKHKVIAADIAKLLVGYLFWSMDVNDDPIVMKNLQDELEWLESVKVPENMSHEQFELTASEKIPIYINEIDDSGLSFINYLKLIRIFSRIEQIHVTFSDKNCIQLLLSIMNHMEKSPEIQKEISALLANLSGQESCRKIMQSMGVLKLMVRNLQNFVSDGKVETEICAVLANLSTNDDIAKEVVQLDVVPILHKLMVRMTGKAEYSDLIVQTFHLLTHMLRVDQNALSGYNFASFISDCIPVAYSICEVATATCNLIGSMAYSQSKLYENEKVLCNFIFKVMSFYPKDKILLITSCFGIAHLINNRVLPDISVVIESQAIKIILEGLEAYKDVPSFLGTVFYTLSLLIPLERTILDEVMKNDGVDTILNTMALTTFPKSRKNKKKLSLHVFNSNSNGASMYRIENDDEDGDGEREEGGQTEESVQNVNNNNNNNNREMEDYDGGSSGEDDEDDDEEGDRRRSNRSQGGVRTVIMSRDAEGERKKYPHHVLCQAFGSIILYHFYVVKEIRPIIMEKGAPVTLYRAYQALEKHSELKYIAFQILARLAMKPGSFGARSLDIKGFYVKWLNVPSMTEMCMLHLLQSRKVLPDVDQVQKYGIICDDSRADPEIKVSSLPDRVKKMLRNVKVCHHCSQLHFNHGIFFFNISGADSSKETSFCSRICMELDVEDVEASPFYYVKKLPPHH